MQVYNTLSRKKEELRPISDDAYRIYVCGPTVYNYFHIGNARPFVVFDTLRRYLEYRGNNVKFIQNFTDVDDKIISKAAEEGVSAGEISERYIDEYYSDAAALNVRRATHHPKVTDNMAQIISFVETLIDKGHAYEVDGDVYYDVSSFSEYGKLSGQDIQELESGARVDVDARKKNALDFALWKSRKTDDEIAWDSPWGQGRPGWHIECSAMSKEYLGDTIDIHAGGQDLTFPHHENEIAQSEAANGVPFANYWMHNGYITIDNAKMSKSEGNFFTVRDILQDYDGEVIRFFLLSGHYRSPINFSRELMDSAKAGLLRIRNAVDTLKHLISKGDIQEGTGDEAALMSLSKYRESFIEFMDDDLNTAGALGAIFEMISEVNLYVKDGSSQDYARKALGRIAELCNVLGLLEDGIAEVAAGDDESWLEALIEERLQARADKNWARADEIRDELAAKGIMLKDTPQGVQIIRDIHE